MESDESLEIPVPSKQEQQILSTEFLRKKIRHSLKFFYLMSEAELLKLSYFYEKTHSDITKRFVLTLRNSQV